VGHLVQPLEFETQAVVLEAPKRLGVRRLALNEPTETDAVVDISWSGISTGTERLLWLGEMPAFPGMGYPLVPGYESVGVVRQAGEHSGLEAGQHVFVPGANCYGPVRGLFGGASQRIVVSGQRVISCPESLAERGVLLTLAATAYHAIDPDRIGAARQLPELIVGHGVLGRLMARILLALGERAPTVWEINPARIDAGSAYGVCHPDADPRRDYRCICDVSGDHAIVDKIVPRLAAGGEIVLAGFYDTVSFAFAPAFMREARLRIAAQFLPKDLAAVMGLVTSGALSLDGLITHTASPTDAVSAYATAFSDPSCLKMVLDWRQHS
jgi:bacteriochlorophyllide a dehydrogenase